MQHIMNDKLKKLIEVSPLSQKNVAAKLGTNKIHLNKILNGKANLTTRMAKKLATISELKTNEQDLIYPALPLDISSFFYAGHHCVQYKTSRPQLYVPTPIRENYFGVIFRGQHHETSKFHLPLNDGECMIFDGSYEKSKTVDPDAIGKLAIIENEKGEMWVGWLDEMGKQSKKHNFNPLGSNAWMHNQIKWASTFVMSFNLCKLEGVDNLVQLD
tara:strand:+ start:454 stop:1098 length:645 start_codon:yes stop_codon:yes gene_type:complete